MEIIEEEEVEEAEEKEAIVGGICMEEEDE
jgi:hypothetical protein